MTNKFLIVAHYSRFLIMFEKNNVKLLQGMGYEVHYATNYQSEDMYQNSVEELKKLGVILHQVDFVRSPFKLPKNVRAYRQLKKIMIEGGYCGVHCHTPMAGALTRLAAKSINLKPILYTAHGFHFYKGCAVKNRLIYENAERYLAHYTDAQITINREDYATAQSFLLRGKAYYVHGVGVDIDAIKTIKLNKHQFRSEQGIPDDAFVFLSVGEINENKNHETAIHAFAKANIDNAYYVICGTGTKQKRVQELIKSIGMEDKVKLLGFRKDVKEILKAVDCFVFPSYREGLSVALMEAMAAGLPCIASKIRGNVDLLGENYEYCFQPSDVTQLCKAMQNIMGNADNQKLYSLNRIKKYDSATVSKEMANIYKEVIENGNKAFGK